MCIVVDSEPIDFRIASLNNKTHWLILFGEKHETILLAVCLQLLGEEQSDFLESSALQPPHVEYTTKYLFIIFMVHSLQTLYNLRGFCEISANLSPLYAARVQHFADFHHRSITLRCFFHVFNGNFSISTRLFMAFNLMCLETLRNLPWKWRALNDAEWKNCMMDGMQSIV